MKGASKLKSKCNFHLIAILGTKILEQNWIKDSWFSKKSKLIQLDVMNGCKKLNENLNGNFFIRRWSSWSHIGERQYGAQPLVVE